MTVKSLDTVPASHGDLHLEIDHLGGSEVLPEKGLEAQSEIDQGARDLEVRAPGAPSPLDPIVMCLEDTHHVVGREVVEAIAIGGNDQEQSERARAEESVVGLCGGHLLDVVCHGDRRLHHHVAAGTGTSALGRQPLLENGNAIVRE